MAEEREEEETADPPEHLPPTTEPSHGPEGPLPRNWREAIPYVVWIVIILGFGLEFTTSLVHGEWLRAVVAGSAMVGVMAVALHWPQLRDWTRRISPNWAVGSLTVLLICLALSPFVEEKRWPFSAWFAGPTSEEAQSLQTRLATATKNLNDAQQQIAREPAQRAADVAQIQAQLSAMQAERDQLKQRLASVPTVTNTNVVELLAKIEAQKEEIARLRGKPLSEQPKISPALGDYLSDAKIDGSIDQTGQLAFTANAVMTLEQFNACVDYAVKNGAEWTKTRRAPLMDLRNIENGKRVQLDLFKIPTDDKGKSTYYYWRAQDWLSYPLVDERLWLTLNDPKLIRARLIFVDALKNEIYYPFSFYLNGKTWEITAVGSDEASKFNFDKSHDGEYPDQCPQK